jgi:hypothetical protein
MYGADEASAVASVARIAIIDGHKKARPAIVRPGHNFQMMM